MASVEKKIEEMMERTFSGSKLVPFRAEEQTDDDFRGFVLWPGFAGMEQIIRQERIESLLQTLPVKDRRRIRWLLTATPREYAAWSRDGFLAKA